MSAFAGIYADEGVSPLSLRATVKALKRVLSPSLLIREMQGRDFLDFRGEDCVLLAFPGGRDRGYYRVLRGAGNRRIREYVFRGGAYLGICAGAYYAANEVVFEKGTSLEVHEKRDLSFFPGSAVGCLYREKKFSYTTETGLHFALIQTEEGLFQSYYNGGCYFQEAESFPDVKILARYVDAEVPGAPAAVFRDFGRGKVFLSGIHPEIDADAIQSSQRARYAFWEKSLCMLVGRERML